MTVFVISNHYCALQWKYLSYWIVYTNHYYHLYQPHMGIPLVLPTFLTTSCGSLSSEHHLSNFPSNLLFEVCSKRKQVSMLLAEASATTSTVNFTPSSYKQIKYLNSIVNN